MSDELKSGIKEQLREIHIELEKRLITIRENIEDKERIEKELYELTIFTTKYQENVFTSKLQDILTRMSLKNILGHSIHSEVDIFLIEINKWKIIDSIVDSLKNGQPN
jgi:hypothetical protein